MAQNKMCRTILWPTLCGGGTKALRSSGFSLLRKYSVTGTEGALCAELLYCQTLLIRTGLPESLWPSR